MNTVTVSKELEDLVPTFLTNRRNEIATLRAALDARDFEQLRQVGHRMKGVGRSYGFAAISEFGLRIEDGARTSDGAAIGTILVEYLGYLEHIHVVYE